MVVNILLWILAILFVVIFTIIAQGPIHWLLVKLFGGFIPRGPRGVRGLWRSIYTYEEDGEQKTENQLVELKQFGKNVVGRNITGKAHWYKIKGKVEMQMYFTGFWEHIGEGDIRHGAFQFAINSTGDRMEGKWIGFDKRHKINDGPWTWKLLSRKLDRETKLKFLQEESSST